VAATADKTVIEGLIKQNGTTIGAVLGRGSVGVAEEGSDGKMHATVRIPMDELVFEPRVVVMPHGGDLELEIINDDNNSTTATRSSSGW
jgi:PQQ system protein